MTVRPQDLAVFSRLPALEFSKVDIGREREMRNCWMRAVQYATVETPSGHSLTAFTTHLCLSGGQKKTGIMSCRDLMRREQLAGRQHILTGDFNIRLDTQP